MRQSSWIATAFMLYTFKVVFNYILNKYCCNRSLHITFMFSFICYLFTLLVYFALVCSSRTWSIWKVYDCNFVGFASCNLNFIICCKTCAWLELLLEFCVTRLTAEKVCWKLTKNKKTLVEFGLKLNVAVLLAIKQNRNLYTYLRFIIK